MAGGENLGAKFSIDITDLKAGLAQANRLIRNSESAFQEAAAGMDDWTDSAEGLQKRVDSLSEQVEIQKEKVAALVKEKQNIINKMTAEGKSNEEIEKAIDGVNKSIEREGKQLSRMQGNLKKNQKALDDYGDSAGDAADNTGDLADESGKAAKPMKSLKDVIEDQEKELEELNDAYVDTALEQGKNSKSAKALKKQINSLSKDLDGNKKKLDRVSDSADDVGESFNGLKTAGAIGAGAIAAVAAAGTAVAAGFLGLAESTRENRENMAKLETTFEAAGLTAEQAGKTYTDLYGVIGDDGQVTEAMQHIAKMSKSQEDLSNWTNIATGIYATFGDSLPIESLTEAANETSKTGTITGALADALNWAGVNEDDFQKKLDACSTEQERQALITETLNNLYGDAAEAYRTNNAEVIAAQEAQANYNAKLAELGEKAEPIMTAVTEGFTKILDAIIGLLDGADFEAIEAGIESGFSYFVDTIIPAVVDGLSWIINNWEIVAAGIAAVGAAFLAFQVVGIIQSVTGALKGMSIAQAALNLIMAMNPIGLVIAAIAGLVAAFVVLWNKCDWFREFWIGLWNTVKEWALNAWTAIKGFFSEAWTFIQGIWAGASEWFSGIWTGISGVFSGVAEWFSGVFTSAWTNIKSAWSSVKTWFSELWTSITSIFDPSDFLSIGKDIVTGLWNGISEKVDWLKEKIKGWTSNIVGWAKGFLGIESPSKVFKEEVGKNMALGVSTGFTGEMKGVASDINRSLAKTIPDVRVNDSGVSSGLASGSRGGVTVNQTNYYSQAHSRYELYKSKQDTAAAVRLALGGA